MLLVRGVGAAAFRRRRMPNSSQIRQRDRGKRSLAQGDIQAKRHPHEFQVEADVAHSGATATGAVENVDQDRHRRTPLLRRHHAPYGLRDRRR